MHSVRMFFAPNLKQKRGTNKNRLVQPFPNLADGKQYVGIFTGISVDVSAKVDIIALYDNGFYGKGSQSRSMPQAVLQSSKQTLQNNVDNGEILCLGLEEAAFLSYYLKILKICDMENREMEFENFLREALEVNDKFVESLATYLYLKSKGWVVKSGLKFGGNFLIYHKGPRFYHASFVVIFNTPYHSQHLISKNLKGLQRIAETSDKDVLLLDINKPNNFKLLRPENIAEIQISELIVRRFNCSSYVQNQNLTK